MSKANEKFLNNRLKAMYGEDFDAIINIAENCVKMQALVKQKEDTGKIEPDDYINANKEWERMGQFTTPKLKSVEHTGENQITEVHIHR